MSAAVRRPRVLALIAAMAVVAGVAVLVAARSGSDHAKAARPDPQRILDGLVAGNGRIAPGATAYVSGPHGTWAGAAGVSDVGTREPMRADARMRLESPSKMWVAAVILQLVGEHRMRLDDTVARWVPGLLPYGGRITVRQLLGHTSGMVNTSDLDGDPERYMRELHDTELRARAIAVSRRAEKDPGYEFSPRLWVELAAALPLEHAPGGAYHYSNIAYAVAGMVAERAGGADLATLVRQRIAGPLGLASAAYDPHSRIAGAHARATAWTATGS